MRVMFVLLVIVGWPLRWIYRSTRRTSSQEETTEVIGPRKRDASTFNAACRPRSMRIFDGVDLVVVAPDGDVAHDAEVFDLLQAGRRSKMLDLRPARELSVDWFKRLSSSWRTTSDADLRQLAVVLDYERWALWAPTIAHALRPLDERGVQVEVFYTQQSHRLGDWFSTGKIHHNHHAVLVWLREDWPKARARGERAASPPTGDDQEGVAERDLESWAIVLRRTAALVERLGTVEEARDLRLELAGIAQTFGGPAGEREALHHLLVALNELSNPPSRATCQVLRWMAALHLSRKEPAEAFRHLDRAVEIATTLNENGEAVLALFGYAHAAMEWRLHARAAKRLRLAIAVGPEHVDKELRANMHYLLARAMLEQGQAGPEALRLAQEALFARSDMNGESADQDRALLMKISARMAGSPVPTTSPLVPRSEVQRDE